MVNFDTRNDEPNLPLLMLWNLLLLQKEREAYEVIVEDGKLVYWRSGELVNTVEGSKWIFVLSTSRNMYVAEKKKGRFQHSSFLAGGATTAAGRLVAHNGVLEVCFIPFRHGHNHHPSTPLTWFSPAICAGYMALQWPLSPNRGELHGVHQLPRGAPCRLDQCEGKFLSTIFLDSNATIYAYICSFLRLFSAEMCSRWWQPNAQNCRQWAEVIRLGKVSLRKHHHLWSSWCRWGHHPGGQTNSNSSRRQRGQNWNRHRTGVWPRQTIVVPMDYWGWSANQGLKGLPCRAQNQSTGASQPIPQDQSGSLWQQQHSSPANPLTKAKPQDPPIPQTFLHGTP